MPVHRHKLSVTISEESYRYLMAKVQSGYATSIAEAVDRALRRIHKLEMRRSLARDTAAYFEKLSAEDNRLGNAMGQAAAEALIANRLDE